MSGKILIERLEFRGRCGITPEERSRPQPLAIDLELDGRLEPAGRSDNLDLTIDYAKIAQRTVDVGTEKECHLLESMAERLLSMLFEEFPIDRAKLWLRKLHPPLAYVTGSVGISVDRTRLAHALQQFDPPPAPFLLQQLHRLPKGKVLDVAAGGGRHSLFLAAQGYQVEAIDRDTNALTHLASAAKKHTLPSVTTRAVDLEQPSPSDPNLGTETYDGIVVFFYLYRSLFPFLMDALKPGGVLIYETFTIDNYFHHQHPRRWEFCLTHNELLRLTSNLHTLHYDEGAHESGHGPGSVYTAQLVAQKAARPSVSL